MDGMMLSGIPTATAKPVQGDRGVTIAPGQALGPAGSAPVDTIEITNAVRPPDAYDQLRLNAEGEPPTPQPPPTLATMLDAIKQYIEEALKRGQEQDREFFQKLEAFQKKLENIKGGENVKAAGDLVAATAPEHKKDFAQAAGQLVDAATGKKGGQPQEEVLGDPPKPVPGDPKKLELSDIKLHVDPSGPNGLTVKLESLRLSVRPDDQPAAPPAPAPPPEKAPEPPPSPNSKAPPQASVSIDAASGKFELKHGE